MIHLTDTHTHLYLEDFAPDNGEVVRRAIESGVTRRIFPNVDLSTVKPMEELAARFPDNIYVAMGLHPTEINDASDNDLATIIDKARNERDKYVAIGEVGMDLYWDKTFEQKQMKALESQLALAEELGLPVIIHCREALDQTLEVMSGFKNLSGVFHSFGGTDEDVEHIRRNHDFYFGINGIVTFKNCRLSRVLPAIGADRILLETDSPYLAPVPHRGKRNESSFIVHTAAFVANSLNKPLDEIAKTTNANSDKLFKFPKSIEI